MLRLQQQQIGRQHEHPSRARRTTELHKRWGTRTHEARRHCTAPKRRQHHQQMKTSGAFSRGRATRLPIPRYDSELQILHQGPRSLSLLPRCRRPPLTGAFRSIKAGALTIWQQHEPKRMGKCCTINQTFCQILYGTTVRGMISWVLAPFPKHSSVRAVYPQSRNVWLRLCSSIPLPSRCRHPAQPRCKHPCYHLGISMRHCLQLGHLVPR